MGSVDDVRNLPVMPDGGPRPLLGDVADVKLGHTAGEIDRYNMQRVVSLHGERARRAARRSGWRDTRRDSARPANLRAGVTVNIRGQIPPLEETMSGLRIGLALAIGAIFLLLAASFQSFRLALASC